MTDLKKILAQAPEALGRIHDILDDQKSVKIAEFSPQNTALVVIDMVNGFVKCGNLSSDRVLKINAPIAALCAEVKARGIQTLAFADTHTNDSVEFLSYPSHCLEGTEEANLSDEIARVGDIKLFPKNSTNAFLAPGFCNWLKENPEIKNFLLVGCCTDICVEQFALTLKAHFNENNQKSRIIVVSSLVQTYHSDFHHADLLQLLSLYQMHLGGVEIVSRVEF